jgi:hypothetical protein
VKKEENTQNCEKQQKERRVGGRDSNDLFIGARFPWEAVSRTAHFSKKKKPETGEGMGDSEYSRGISSDRWSRSKPANLSPL